MLQGNYENEQLWVPMKLVSKEYTREEMEAARGRVNPMGLASKTLAEARAGHKKFFLTESDGSEDERDITARIRPQQVVMRPRTMAMLAKGSTRTFSDTGATYHCTDDLTRLDRVVECNVYCGGVGEGVRFTHVGIDVTMPIGLRKTYYGPAVPPLTSLGYLSSSGRCAFMQDTDRLLHVYVDNELFFTAEKQPNNLYPADIVQWSGHSSVHGESLLTDEEYARSERSKLKLESGFPKEKVAQLAAMHYKLMNDFPYVRTGNASVVSSVKAYTAAFHGLNKEQRGRIELAEALERYLHYPSNEAVSTALSMGSFAQA